MAELEEVGQLLKRSLDPSQRRQAEAALLQKEAQPGFSILLLHVIALETPDQALRLSASLYFKNFIKRNWSNEDGEHKLPEGEVATIKHEIIGLMASVPAKIQSQLGEAISVIADSDFWERWHALVDDLVARLTPDNTVVNIGLLQVAHSIFKRWQPLFRTDELYTEINHVLERFANPFLQLLQHTDQLLQSQQNDKAELQLTANLLSLEIKLFYDLSSQDMPPQFEENLLALSSLLEKYISYDNVLLHTDEDSESGPLEFIKASIFEALTLYTQKYEEFAPHIPAHVTSCWTFLTNVGSETKYDILVSRALQFLTAVANNKSHAQLFAAEATIAEILQRVILPNVTLRPSDLEMFEDEPIEFIRRDLEGSDNDTRRRAATDFLRQLVVHHEHQTTSVVLAQIKSHLDTSARNASDNCQDKDTAIYLFCAIAAKGAATAGQGVKTVNPHINLVEFFQNNIAHDLTSTLAHPLLLVDAIKFLHIFRSILTRDLWLAAFPLLVQHLNSSHYVVYTYAAIVVERVLNLVGHDNLPIIPQSQVVGLSRDLLQHLFSIIVRNTDATKVQENEFLMRCVMRVLIVIRQHVAPIADMVLQNFINITMVIRHNPSNPKFYYYHFEGIGALIRYSAPSRLADLEAALYKPCTAVLEADAHEFAPYVFQLFAALLEANPSHSLPEYYQSLITPVLMPATWDSRGNIPALVRLLSAIIARGADIIIQNKQLEPILGIFQKLISIRASEAHGFDLLEAVVSYFPPQALQLYWTPMLQLILQRLSAPDKKKSEVFQSRFARFYHFCSARDKQGLGPDFFIGACDQIQNDVFRPVYTSIILPETQKFSRFHDKKIAVVSLTKTLADSQAFADRYPKGWPLTCESLLRLLVDPPMLSRSTEQDMIVEADTDDVAFGVGFTQLNTCRKSVQDPYPEASNVKAWVGTYLREADGRHAGRIARFVAERLNEQQRAALQTLMS